MEKYRLEYQNKTVQKNSMIFNNISINNMKKRMGIYYTADDLAFQLVYFTLKNHFAPIFNKIKLVNKSLREMSRHEHKELKILLYTQFERIFETSICDPAVGAGIFLKHAFRFLYDLFDNIYSLCSLVCNKNNAVPSIHLLFTIFKSDSPQNRLKWAYLIITKMLFGADLSQNAIKITEKTLLSEYSAIYEDLLKKEKKIKQKEKKNAQEELLKKSIYQQQNSFFWLEPDKISPLICLNLIHGNSICPVNANINPFCNIALKKNNSSLQKIIKIRNDLRSFGILERENGNNSTSLRQTMESLQNSLIYHKSLLYSQIKNYPFSEYEQELPFSWILECPEIFLDSNGKPRDNPGFSIILCNPPWKNHQLNEIDFFSQYLSTYNTIPTKERKLKKSAFLQDPEVSKEYDTKIRNLRQLNHFFGEIYSLQGERKFNLFKLFLERSFHLMKRTGSAGWITPLGIFGEARATNLRNFLFKHVQTLTIIPYFSDSNLFPSITKGQPFSAFSFMRGSKLSHICLVPSENSSNLMFISSDSESILLSVKLIELISPKIRLAGQWVKMNSIPLLCNKSEVSLLMHLSQKPVFRDGWHLQSKRELNRTDDERNGLLQRNTGTIPVIEGKHLVHYGFSSQQVRFFINDNVNYKTYRPIITKPRIVWRNVSNIRLQRRMFCALLPPNHATVNSLNYISEISSGPLKRPELTENERFFLLGLLGSLICEYQIRLFSMNNNLNQYLIENLAIPLYQAKNPIHRKFVNTIKKFIPVANRWADEMVKNIHNAAVKAKLTQKYWPSMAKIDALTLKIYNLNLDDLAIIRVKFPKIDSKYFSYIIQCFNSTIA
ncbi:MAG: hypothetical protein K9W44_07075 [Candidatus Lokiarchaeota archaeon]|nr:hypothetical protein [Candidatus Harpocratesius repetitus]